MHIIRFSEKLCMDFLSNSGSCGGLSQLLLEKRLDTSWVGQSYGELERQTSIHNHIYTYW